MKEYYASCSQENGSRRRGGFTLIEMIGVLAIIAILAVVIVPKVFDAIRSSKINGTLVSIDTYKTAVVDFVGKYGTIPTTNGNARIDDLLKTAGMVDDRFSSKLGIQTDVYSVAGSTWTNTNGVWGYTGGTNQGNVSRIICLTSNTTSPEKANGANFKLDGTANMPSKSRVISAVIEDMLAAEARELSLRVDGEEFSSTSGTADSKGRVVFNTPNSAGIIDVYIYMMHQ